MAIVCVIANFVFKLTKNAVLVCLESFPKLKGPRAPSQNCKKNPCVTYPYHFPGYGPLINNVYKTTNSVSGKACSPTKAWSGKSYLWHQLVAFQQNF